MRQSTKQAIAETLYELLETDTIEQITVTRIVECCGINRQTFYYHFKDIYDLLEWALANRLEKEFNEMSSPKSDWEAAVRYVFNFLYSRRNLIIHAYDSSHRKLYELFIVRLLRPIIEARVKSCTYSQMVSDEKREFVIDVHVKIFTSMFFDWVEDGMPDEDITHLDDYFTIVDGSIEASLKKFIKK